MLFFVNDYVFNKKRAENVSFSALLTICKCLFLLQHDLELRSSSFTFGSAIKLSLLSPNHDLTTVVEVEALAGGGGVEATAFD